MPRELRLGTRGSQLALWQANAVAARLQENGGLACRIVVISTSGDQLQQAPLSDVGGKRLFVKEIESALLRAEIDLAVHSSKDMPAILPQGLTIGAVLPREDPLDAIVVPPTVHPESGKVEDVVAALGSSPPDRDEQRPARRAVDAALSAREVRADSWQSRHAAPQARSR